GIDVETSGAAVVRSGRVSRMILAASPEAMAGARPGTYVMRAELEQGGLMPWGWRGHLVSAPVTIVVREADRTSNREALEGARSAMSTHYFLAADRPEDARRAALDWSQRDPKNPFPLMLLGDAVAALGPPRAPPGHELRCRIAKTVEDAVWEIANDERVIRSKLDRRIGDHRVAFAGFQDSRLRGVRSVHARHIRGPRLADEHLVAACDQGQGDDEDGAPGMNRDRDGQAERSRID